MSGFLRSSESLIVMLLFIMSASPFHDCAYSSRFEGNSVVQDSIRQAFNDTVSGIGARSFWMTLGPGNSVYAVAFNDSRELIDQGKYELFLHKWDFQANHIWTAIWDAGDIAIPNAIAADASGVLVTGRGFDDKVWVGKWDHNGNQLWYRTWQKSPWQEGAAIAALNDGSILAGCLVRGPLVDDHIYNHTFDLLKYTSSGNLVWSKTAEWYLDESGHPQGFGSFNIHVLQQNEVYFSTPYSLFEVADEGVGLRIWWWNTSSFYTRRNLSPDGIFYSTSGLTVSGRTANGSTSFNITFQLVPWQYSPSLWGIRGWKDRSVFVLQSYSNDVGSHLMLQKYNHHGTQIWNKTLQYGGSLVHADRVKEFLFSDSGCAYFLVQDARSDLIVMDLLVYEIEGPCVGYVDTGGFNPIIVGVILLGAFAAVAVVLSRRFIMRKTS
ncbi:MAG: hypothetical protein ACFFAY_10565 [Promethearchaeota archaeon]